MKRNGTPIKHPRKTDWEYKRHQFTGLFFLSATHFQKEAFKEGTEPKKTWQMLQSPGKSQFSRLSNQGKAGKNYSTPGQEEID